MELQEKFSLWKQRSPFVLEIFHSQTYVYDSNFSLLKLYELLLCL